MSCRDPATLSYREVDRPEFELAAAAYQEGLRERLATRGIVTTEQLPTLTVLGHSEGAGAWTRIGTRQGTGWFLGSRVVGAALVELARDLGQSDGDDWWAEA